jgi:hypothetical protein
MFASYGFVGENSKNFSRKCDIFVEISTILATVIFVCVYVLEKIGEMSHFR